MQEEYRFLKQLGFGQCPIHYAIRLADSKEVAIKKIPYGSMSKSQKEKVVTEVNSLIEIKSASHVVRYYDHFIDKTTSELFIAMEYCKGGSLESYLNQHRAQGKFVSEKAIWEIISQVVMGLSEIHHQLKTHIIHRNIKPSNIFWDDEKKLVKIGDFGYMAKLESERDFSKTLNTNTYYLSPEQIDNYGCSMKTDIWALGCLIYQMATLKHPFAASQQFQVVKRIKSGRLLPLPNHYSKELTRVIHLCLSKNPEERPSAYQISYYPEICTRIKEKQNRYNKGKVKDYKLKVEDKEKQIKRLQEEVMLLNQQIDSGSKVTDKTYSFKSEETRFISPSLLMKRSLY